MEEPGIIFLEPGDKVRVNLTGKAFRQLQDNDKYGGWHDDMDKVWHSVNFIDIFTRVLVLQSYLRYPIHK